MQKKPANSTKENLIPKNMEASRVAEAGSKQPIRVVLTGLICFTPSRKTEKPSAVPITIIIVIIRQAMKSRSLVKIQALVKIDMRMPPRSHAPTSYDNVPPRNYNWSRKKCIGYQGPHDCQL